MGNDVVTLHVQGPDEGEVRPKHGDDLEVPDEGVELQLQPVGNTPTAPGLLGQDTKTTSPVSQLQSSTPGQWRGGEVGGRQLL